MNAASLTPPEHEHSAAICIAAAWLRSIPQAERPHPIIPALRERFGLTAGEAVQAIREARDDQQ